MSKSATAESQTVMPSLRTWNAILTLAQQGQDCEKQIDSLQKSMKATKRQLGELGIGPKVTATPEWKLLSDAYTLTDLTLDSLRARLKDLSSQSNTLVCGAAQGKIFDDAEVDKILDGKNTATGTLYDRAMKTAQSAGVKPEVGESDEDAAKRKKPSPLDVQITPLQKSLKLDAGVPVGDDWRKVGIDKMANLVEIKDRKALQDAGLMTAGDIEIFIFKDKRFLTAVPGMSKKGAGDLTEWVEARRHEPTQQDAADTAGLHPGTPNGKHTKPKPGKKAGK